MTREEFEAAFADDFNGILWRAFADADPIHGIEKAQAFNKFRSATLAGKALRDRMFQALTKESTDGPTRTETANRHGGKPDNSEIRATSNAQHAPTNTPAGKHQQAPTGSTAGAKKAGS